MTVCVKADLTRSLVAGQKGMRTPNKAKVTEGRFICLMRRAAACHKRAKSHFEGDLRLWTTKIPTN